MKKKLAAIAFAGASLAMFATAPGAGAGHCASPDGTSPGFSYFGTDHVKESNHGEGANDEDNPHTPGASNCRDTTGSPSERAPGQKQ